jgi:hypothetical protein
MRYNEYCPEVFRYMTRLSEGIIDDFFLFFGLSRFWAEAQNKESQN